MRYNACELLRGVGELSEWAWERLASACQHVQHRLCGSTYWSRRVADPVPRPNPSTLPGSCTWTDPLFFLAVLHCLMYESRPDACYSRRQSGQALTVLPRLLLLRAQAKRWGPLADAKAGYTPTQDREGSGCSYSRADSDDDGERVQQGGASKGRVGEKGGEDGGKRKAHSGRAKAAAAAPLKKHAGAPVACGKRHNLLWRARRIVLARAALDAQPRHCR